jgi:hypothetical protein
MPIVFWHHVVCPLRIPVVFCLFPLLPLLLFFVFLSIALDAPLRHAFRTIAYPPFKVQHFQDDFFGHQFISRTFLTSTHIIPSLFATPSSLLSTQPPPYITHISNPIMLSYGSIAVARVQRRVMVVQGTYTTNLLLKSIL